MYSSIHDLLQLPGAGAGAGQHAALRRHGLPPLQLPRHGRQHPRGEHTKYLTPPRNLEMGIYLYTLFPS